MDEVENLKKSVGIRAQAIRERLGYKNRELFAEVLDVHSNTVGQLERGTTWLSPEMVLLYRDKLGVDPAEFLTDSPVIIQPTPEEALEVLRVALANQQKPGPTKELQDLFLKLSDRQRSHYIKVLKAELGL